MTHMMFFQFWNMWFVLGYAFITGIKSSWYAFIRTWVCFHYEYRILKFRHCPLFMGGKQICWFVALPKMFQLPGINILVSKNSNFIHWLVRWVWTLECCLKIFNEIRGPHYQSQKLKVILQILSHLYSLVAISEQFVGRFQQLTDGTVLLTSVIHARNW